MTQFLDLCEFYVRYRIVVIEKQRVEVGALRNNKLGRELEGSLGGRGSSLEDHWERLKP